MNEAHPVALATTKPSIPAARWMRIIPATIVVYTIAYMDRMNISFAIAGGINKSLSLSPAAAGMAAGVFFFGYVLLQVPAGHISEHGSARKYILWTILAWGGISLITALVQNAWQLYGMRFLLGVAEGGLYPSLLTVIGNWFPRRELGRANAFFLMSLPLSTLFTNPVSGWIVNNFSWRWLFAVEGCISLSLIAIWLPLISDRPEGANWISEAEKDYLVTTLAAEKEEKLGSSRTWDIKGYWSLLADRNLWLLVALLICYTSGQYGFSIWLPTLIKSLTGQNLTTVGWLSSLPYLTALGGLYFFGALTDRTRNPRFCTVLSLVGFGLSFWLATLFPRHAWISVALLVLTGCFTKAMQAPFWVMPQLLFRSGLSGGSRGIINALGNLGGFLGPSLMGWLAGKTGDLRFGILGLSLLLLLSAGFTALLPRVTYQRSQSR